MMICRSLSIFLLAIVVALIVASYSTVDAFVQISRPTDPSMLSSFTRSATPYHPSPTILSMAEEGSSEKGRSNRAETDTTEEEEQQQQQEGSSASGTDILNSPAFLKRKLEVLKSDIEKTEQDVQAALERAEIAKEEWGPQLEDLQREYSNIRDRMTSANEQGDTQAIVRVTQEVLALLDNFDRAYGAIKPETDSEREIEREYKAAYQLILETLEKLGVIAVKTIGEEFDYEVHQAVMQMPGTDFEEGIVCQELQKGFIMGETLIRPAMVAVAA